MRSALLCVLLVAGCTPSTTYYQRTARSPHPTVPLDDGQPMAHPYAINVGVSNAADLTDPQVGNAAASVETPTVQVRGELKLRLGDRGAFVMSGERGIAGYRRVDPTLPPAGEGSPTGVGIGLRYAADLGYPGWSLGMQLDLAHWSIPYGEYTCSDATCAQYTAGTHATDGATTFGVGVTPSYRSGNLTVFGGVYARNEPTISRSASSGGDPQVIEPGRDEVENGPFNVLVHAGVSYRFADNVVGLADVHQDLVKDPVAFGPGIGCALQFELGANHPHPARTTFASPPR